MLFFTPETVNLKKTNFCKCRNKNGKLFTSCVTLFEEKRSKTFLYDFSGMYGFLLQYSSNKREEFYPT